MPGALAWTGARLNADGSVSGGPLAGQDGQAFVVEDSLGLFHLYISQQGGAKPIEEADNLEVSSAWFGTVGNNTGDEHAALQRAVDHCRDFFNATGSTRSITLRIPAGQYRLGSSLDCTGLDARFFRIKGAGRRHTILAGIGSSIGNYAIIDCTAANGMLLTDLTVYAEGDCYIGILQSRQSTGSSGTHRFEGVEVEGNFTMACIYRISAEETTYIDIECNNTYAGNGARGMVLVDTPEAGVDSLYLPLGAISGGNTVHRFFGGRLVVKYDGGQPNNRALYVKNARSLTIDNTYFNAGNLGSDACIEFKGVSIAAMTGCVVEGSPAAAILCSGDIDCLSLRAFYYGIAQSNRGVKVLAGVTVRQLSFDGITGSGTYCLETEAGSTLKNSNIRMAERAAIIAGTSQYNTYEWSDTLGNLSITGTSTNDRKIFNGQLLEPRMTDPTVAGTLTGDNITIGGLLTGPRERSIETTHNIVDAAPTEIYDPTAMGYNHLVDVHITCNDASLHGYARVSWDGAIAAILEDGASAAGLSFSIASNKLNVTHNIGGTRPFTVHIAPRLS